MNTIEVGLGLLHCHGSPPDSVILLVVTGAAPHGAVKLVLPGRGLRKGRKDVAFDMHEPHRNVLVRLE